MAIKYTQGNNDDLGPLVSVSIDDDSGTSWWGGAQKCFAQVALAAVIATTALATQIGQQISQDREEIPAGYLTSTAYVSSAPQAFQVKLKGGGYVVRYAPDSDELPVTVANQPAEDYWSSGVAPVWQIFFHAPLLGDQDEIPAGSLLSGQLNEDLWINPVPPVPWSLWQPLPYGFDSGDFVPAVTLQPDEDFWQSGVSPTWLSFYQKLPFVDPDEIPGSLFGQFDEDFWCNPVSSVPPSLYQRLPLGDPEEIPAGSLSGQQDSDFWLNPSRPIAPALYQPLPYLFDAAEFTSSFEAEEDSWENQVPPVPSSNRWPQQWAFDDQDPAGNLYGQFDEDFWRNPVAPVSANTYRSPLFSDPEEVPAGALLKSQAVEEPYWLNSVWPVSGNLYQPLPYGFDAIEVVGAVQNGTALPAGLSLVAAENDPTASVQAARGGRRGRPLRGTFIPPPSISAIARPSSLSIHVEHGEVSAFGTARALVAAVPTLRATDGKPTAKGIRNPSDEELIAILMGA